MAKSSRPQRELAGQVGCGTLRSLTLLSGDSGKLLGAQVLPPVLRIQPHEDPCWVEADHFSYSERWQPAFAKVEDMTGGTPQIRCQARRVPQGFRQSDVKICYREVPLGGNFPLSGNCWFSFLHTSNVRCQMDLVCRVRNGMEMPHGGQHSALVGSTWDTLIPCGNEQSGECRREQTGIGSN